MCKKRKIHTVGELAVALMTSFNRLNEAFFNGELQKVIITTKDGYRNHAYGWIEVNKNWIQGKNERYELNISCDYLNRSVYEILGTIMHEMCHLYALQNGIKDTSNKGVYHNERFRQIAEEHHLHCSCVDKSGWTVTKPDDIFKSWIDSNIPFTEILVFKQKPLEKESKENKPKQSMRKYVCPECGLIIRATKDCSVMCMECEKEMIKEI